MAERLHVTMNGLILILIFEIFLLCLGSGVRCLGDDYGVLIVKRGFCWVGDIEAGRRFVCVLRV